VYNGCIAYIEHNNEKKVFADGKEIISQNELYTLQNNVKEKKLALDMLICKKEQHWYARKMRTAFFTAFESLHRDKFLVNLLARIEEGDLAQGNKSAKIVVSAMFTPSIFYKDDWHEGAAGTGVANVLKGSSASTMKSAKAAFARRFGGIANTKIDISRQIEEKNIHVNIEIANAASYKQSKQHQQNSAVGEQKAKGREPVKRPRQNQRRMNGAARNTKAQSVSYLLQHYDGIRNHGE
jgi:hypothetical protein